MNERPPINVRCRLFWMDSKNTRPTIAETVGINNAPQNIRVADNGSDRAGVWFWLPFAFSSVSSLQWRSGRSEWNCKSYVCGWRHVTMMHIGNGIAWHFQGTYVVVGNTKFNNGNFRAIFCLLWMNRNSISSQQIIRPRTKAAGMAGKPINNTNGSARSNISNPFLCPNTCSTWARWEKQGEKGRVINAMAEWNIWKCTFSIICSFTLTVTAPYVTAVQYNEPTMTPAAKNGLNRLMIESTPSKMLTNVPISGNTMMYSLRHCGQLTRLKALPFCFSSTHRCRHDWCTHFVVPLHLHGCTQAAILSSSSVAKHTQQYRPSSVDFCVPSISSICTRSSFRATTSRSRSDPVALSSCVSFVFEFAGRSNVRTNALNSRANSSSDLFVILCVCVCFVIFAPTKWKKFSTFTYRRNQYVSVVLFFVCAG